MTCRYLRARQDNDARQSAQTTAHQFQIRSERLTQLEWIAIHLQVSITLSSRLVFNARLPSVAFDNNFGAILVDSEINARYFHDSRARSPESALILTIKSGVTAKTKRGNRQLESLCRAALRPGQRGGSLRDSCRDPRTSRSQFHCRSNSESRAESYRATRAQSPSRAGPCACSNPSVALRKAK